MPLLHVILRSPEETAAFGADLAPLLRAGDVLALDGDLGAGKTTLVRAVAAALGVDPAAVASPTFVIAAEYAPASALAPPLVHVDAYRLSGAEDLEAAGYEHLDDGDAVVLVEWAARVAGALAPAADEGRLARLALVHTGPETRTIRLDVPASWPARRGWSGLAAWAPQARTSTPCPACGHPTPPDAPDWPFTNARCRLADLDRWFTGQYAVSRDEAPPE